MLVRGHDFYSVCRMGGLMIVVVSNRLLEGGGYS